MTQPNNTKLPTVAELAAEDVNKPGVYAFADTDGRKHVVEVILATHTVTFKGEEDYDPESDFHPDGKAITIVCHREGDVDIQQNKRFYGGYGMDPDGAVTRCLKSYGVWAEELIIRDKQHEINRAEVRAWKIKNGWKLS